jgi:diguanylate cyclase (GGDEF)-like protein
MSEPGPDKNENRPNPASSLEPYAQLIRSLLPRATSCFLFDATGRLDWSSEPTIGPDLVNLVDDTLLAARSEPEAAGQLRLIEGNVPVYACWMRDDAGELMAVLAVMCRRSGGGVDEPRAFSFVYSLLRPALECLRRDFLARQAIEDLNETVSELDRDLELLLADPAQLQGQLRSSDELKSIAQNAVDHLKCSMAALLVPQKGVAMLRCRPGAKPDPQLLARTHRQLISMAQMRAEPLIINRVAPSAVAGIIPYRILSCPVRHPSGRTLGVLALFREHEGPEFVQRDARLAEVIARRAAAIVESQYDALSGLYTRAALEQRARGTIAENGGAEAWSALYIDADQLHVINDNFGMHVGDQIIGQLGELIRSRLPPGALAARISGDRFAALLPNHAEDAAQIAEGLRAGAELLGAAQPNGRVHVSISIGVAPLATGAGELSHALAAAESACKAAKDRGRNRVAVYEADDVSVVRRFGDITLAARLRNAIDTQRLRLDAQLVVPFESGSTLPPHYELLLRMISEDGSTLGPDSFLSAANRYQLMPTIDRWVVERTIALLQPNASLLAQRPAVFAINFSGQSLNDDGFGDFLLRAIETSGLDPALFCFELTESATIANVTRAELLMRRLRRLGCGVALDDFGTGLSSLSYLRQLPVTILKIDGSFVRDILKDTRAESMVRAIAQLARNMSLTTVAEYVETEEIRARVSTLGVDYGQGFAIGRPAPFQEVLEQLPMLAAASPAYIVEEAAEPELAANEEVAVPTVHAAVESELDPNAETDRRPVIGF